MPQIPTRRAYSAEELLALRRSASSEPALAIQEKANDGAIRDHVVRGSRSSATRSASSVFGSELLRPPSDTHVALTGPILTEIDPNNQRLRPPLGAKSSPTPSIKKKKAEQILQQHGSPPGIRVTAGGRIVPSEHSPLCSPRYGYSAIQRNGGLIKFAPGYPPPPKTFPNFAKSLPNGFVAQDPAGRLCQMVDGRFLQIPEVNGIPQLFITAPNVTNVAWGQFHSSSDKSPDLEQPKQDVAPKPDVARSTPGPSVAAQVAALEKQYQKLEVERRNLDKAEVLKRNELTGKSYTQLIQKRRELVNRQDELRRSIKTLQETQYAAEAASDARSARSSPAMQTHQFMMQEIPRMSDWSEENTTSHQQPSIMMPSVPQEQQVMLPQAYFSTNFPGYMPIQAFAPMAPTSMAPEGLAGVFAPGSMPMPIVNSMAPRPSMVSNSRHSDDENDTGRTAMSGSQIPRSALNPMSPIYEPAGSKSTTPEKKRTAVLAEYSGQSVAPTTASHIQRSGGAASEQSLHNSSDSSYATTDFFPNNPRDHSLKQDFYPVTGNAAKTETDNSLTMHHSASDEAIAQPEMERHNVNWNPTILDQAFQRVLPEDRLDGKSRFQDVEVQTRGTPPSATSSPGGHDEFTQGYNAGLRREPIDSDTGNAFLAGYCKGLLQSASMPTSLEDIVHPTKPVVKLPSISSASQRDESIRAVSRSSLKNHSLLPLSVGTSLQGQQQNSTPSNAGQATILPEVQGTLGFHMQDRSSESGTQRQIEQTSDENLKAHLSIHIGQQTLVGAPPKFVASVNNDKGAPTRDDSDSILGTKYDETAAEHRVFSAQSQPAQSSQNPYLQRMYPGLRVLSSPGMDWKSGTSMAHVAGMATGYFAQFDGTSSKPATKIPGHIGFAGPAATKYKESSMPKEDQPPTPPPKTSASPSPRKSISPAKAKFAAIAGKAGIKVRTDRPTSKESNELEPMSPQERRRWRDVWKKRNTTIE